MRGKLTVSSSEPATGEPLDSLTLTVLWGRLIAVCEEMGRALIRTAYSEGVREAEDLATGLFDADGRLVAQADYAPGHLGAMPEVMRNFLRKFPAETLGVGDVLVLNDLYMNSGHFNDIYMCMPVHVTDRLVGFVVNSVHHVDVGGMAPGSQSVEGVVDFYQEGLRLLPTRLYESGQPNQGVLDVIAANVRTPELCLGDLRAQHSALVVGAHRFAAAVDEYGESAVREGMAQILSSSESAARASIRAIPDGTYVAEDLLDDFGPGTERVLVRAAVRVAGDQITVDLSGGSPQTASGFNCPINFTRAQCYYTVKALAYPDLPQNEGGIRPITIEAPLGSFFNPRPPAAAGGRSIIGTRLFEVVQAALAQAIPDQAMARNSHWANLTIGGADPSGDRNFVYWDVLIGGLGARMSRDGGNSLALPFNSNNIPVEVHEIHHPIRIERVELIQDSGGAGRFRGGLGMRKDVRVLVDGARVYALTDRHVVPPGGIAGGQSGHTGDVVSCRISGAGGSGNPLEREVSAVLRDVANGYVSAAAAAADYGVVVTRAGGLDQARTAAKRASSVASGRHRGRARDS